MLLALVPLKSTSPSEGLIHVAPLRLTFSFLTFSTSSILVHNSCFALLEKSRKVYAKDTHSKKLATDQSSAEKVLTSRNIQKTEE